MHFRTCMIKPCSSRYKTKTMRSSRHACAGQEKILRWLERETAHPCRTRQPRQGPAPEVTSAPDAGEAPAPTKEELDAALDRLKPERALDTGGVLVAATRISAGFAL